jgi:hypothetical protein
MSTLIRVFAVALALTVPASALANDRLKKFTDVINALAKQAGGPKGSLVVNGGFEEPVVRQGAYVTYQPGQSFMGWQVLGPSGGVSPISGDYANAGVRFVAREGKQWLDLTGPSANTDAGVQQTVQTKPGQVYDLAFWVGNVSAGGFGTVSTVEAFVDGQSLGLARNDQTIPGQQGWGLFKMQVTATGNTMTLAFINRDPSNDNSNGLDAVSLVPAQVAQASPAPAAAQSTVAAPSADPTDAPAAAVPTSDNAAVEAIQSATAGKMKATKGKTYDQECGQDIEYEAEALDLNGDGQLEVMTQEFGTCFGRAGVQMNLFLKAKNGQWTPQFGFPGSPKVLQTKSQGFPDIEVLGPGMCFPVWRYDGQQYQNIKHCR